ncbi:MAG: T9SS type A sorting domain-containing protein [Flavobacteriales bacterium]|nr:T9SS type A sorting domain-containing protein [Flavobacteriales bacterium]
MMPTRMKHVLVCLAFAFGGTARAQTTTSVQNGDWDDPATWDCNCIPDVVDAVVVHEVRIAGNTFFYQRVHVMSGGSLVMDAFFSVVIGDTVINDGFMDLKGDIDVDWALFNNATIHIEGVIHNDALLVMGGPDALLSTDNIGNYGTIEGEGRICVAGFSENTGTIQGQIDVCDLTPTVSSPPFLDVNSGTVAGSVSFCVGESCGPMAIADRNVLADARLWPFPAQHELYVEAPVGSSLTIIDAIGRTVLALTKLNAARVTVDISSLPPGTYIALLRAGEEQRTFAVVLAR